MKFKLLSDLHLEFYKDNLWEPEVYEDDLNTTLILAGDINVGANAQKWITKMTKRFKHVIYVLGNHEFYNLEYNDVIAFWRDVDIADNFIFLEDGWVLIDDVYIFGATMWTEALGSNARFGQRMMSDYRVIRYNGRKLTVGDTNNIFIGTKVLLEDFLIKMKGKKKVVVTHHLPHDKCVAERFKGSNLNDFFRTDLDHIFEQHDINVWCHGHTHDPVDIEVHGTRILCNPRGYPGENMPKHYNENLTFNV